MQGVIVTGIRRDRIVWGRLYMEVIEHAGGDIDTMVQETYRPQPISETSGRQIGDQTTAVSGVRAYRADHA